MQAMSWDIGGQVLGRLVSREAQAEINEEWHAGVGDQTVRVAPSVLGPSQVESLTQNRWRSSKVSKAREDGLDGGQAVVPDV
jgi:hypothetical protein